MSQLDIQLSRLSAHDRALAQAQMARAEALVDVASTVGAWLRNLAAAVAAPVVSRVRAMNERRTRRWPHAKGKDEVAEFPSIGLQH